MSPACASRAAAVAPRHETDAAAVGGRVLQLVRTIEGELLPPRSPGAPSLPAVADDEMMRFVQALLAPSDSEWAGQIARMRECGVGVESIYMGLLAPAARLLGEMWEDDRVMFSDVTVAVGRLHRIVRGLSPALAHELPASAETRRVLLLPAPGEQHTFGLSMVAEFFRRAGWEVVCELDSRAADPVRRVRREWFDVVGISVGVDARLEWLRTGIATIRRASRNRALAIIVGGPVFAHDAHRAAELGADASAADASEAPALAARLVDAKAERP